MLIYCSCGSGRWIVAPYEFEISSEIVFGATLDRGSIIPFWSYRPYFYAQKCLMDVIDFCFSYSLVGIVGAPKNQMRYPAVPLWKLCRVEFRFFKYFNQVCFAGGYIHYYRTIGLWKEMDMALLDVMGYNTFLMLFLPFGAGHERDLFRRDTRWNYRKL